MTSKLPRSWRLDLAHDGRTITEPEVGPADHRGTLITIALWARRHRAGVDDVRELVDMLGLDVKAARQ